MLLLIRCRTRIRSRHSLHKLLAITRGCGFNGRDVDFLHGLHGGKGALGGFAPGGEGVGQHTRDDLPAQPPAVDAPAAFRRLPTVAHDGLPIAVGFFLGIGGDLEGKRLAVLGVGPAVEAEAGDACPGRRYSEKKKIIIIIILRSPTPCSGVFYAIKIVRAEYFAQQ